MSALTSLLSAYGEYTHRKL